MTDTPKTRAFRRYLLSLGWLAGGLLGLVAGLNYFVDPYDYFERNSLGVYVTNGEREVKQSGLDRYPERAVLLGDSKAGMMDVSQTQESAKIFNAGFGSATPEETVAMVKKISPQAPFVLVGLDYFQFGSTAPFAPEPFAKRDFWNGINHLFSGQVLSDSFRTLTGHFRGKQKAFHPDGSFDATDWRAHNDVANPAALVRVFDDRENLARQFRFSPERIALLPILRKALDDRNKPYLVYISPLVEEDWRRMEKAGLLPEYQKWSTAVHTVFPDVIDLAHSVYSDPANFFRLDPMHFYPDTGTAILNRELLPRLNPPSRSLPPIP